MWNFVAIFICAVLFFIVAISCVMAVAASMRSAQLSRFEEKFYE